MKILPSSEQSKLNYRAFFPEDTAAKEFFGPIVPLKEICYISVGMVLNAHEKLAPGVFKLKDLVSDKKDSIHPKPFLEGKHLDRWLPTSHKWLEWGTKRAPALFRRPTFQELYEAEEKILILRVAGKKIRACFDDRETFCNHTALVCLPW